MGALIALTLFGVLNLFLGFKAGKNVLLFNTILGLVAALILTYTGYELPAHLVADMLKDTDESRTFSTIILVGALVVMPLGHFYNSRPQAHAAEYYAIMLFSLVGALMLTSFENLIMLFVGVETLSISMYVLAGSDKRNIASNEAALKYFLMGAFATGIILFGIALLYGATGSFFINDFNKYLAESDLNGAVLAYCGIFLLIGGMLFKVGAAPFHFWTPDVYDGAPTFFTAFMATVVKTATVAALFKLLVISFSTGAAVWWYTLYYAAIATLVIGNLVATAQNSFKRMLAYSSISHAGYMLMAILVLNQGAFKALTFYTVVYTLSSVVAFGALIVMQHYKENDSFIAFNGLAKSHPALALLLTLALLSMAGIPLTAGFFAKLFVFTEVLHKGYIWILIVAVLMSAVGVYYYFRAIINMYFKVGDANLSLSVPLPMSVTMYFCAACILILGLFPEILLKWL